MRLPTVMICILFVVNIIIDLIICLNTKRKYQNKWQSKLTISALIVVWIMLITAIMLPRRDAGADLQPVMWLLYTFLSLFIPKTCYAITCLFDFIPKLWNSKPVNISKLFGLPLAIVVFCAIWWGALVTRNSLHVSRPVVEFSSLPNEFDGYKIVQISDIHAGTWGKDTVFLSKMVDTINALSPDLILFTGDIVNRHTSELLPFKQTLSRLKARQGVYSVLGNHDYGDYMDWNFPIDKENNNLQLKNIQKEMGWNMLNNQHTILHQGSDSIVLIGVENWGEPPFSVYGNLKKAYPNLTDSNFKILLTHNPEHWSREVVKISNIDLSLSGHTHGMQLIFQIGDWKWSPAMWKYKQWGGLYEKENTQQKTSKLYVNIGLGEVALPFRLGATPEITLITLKKSEQ